MSVIEREQSVPSPGTLQESREFFEENGYAVVRGLFDREEVIALREHYMTLRANGAYPGDMVGVEPTSDDPLKRFPRMIHMHRWDDTSLDWALDSRLRDSLTALLGQAPFLGQTMIYFKPAGARGQALHQDNWYLKVAPGTCVAAWMALDPCTEANGCMQVIPGSHRWPLLCTKKADVTKSFTDVTVPIPDDVQPVSVTMEAGDVLFFNGSLVHGSYPNTTTDQFRRSLIAHYVAGEAEQATRFLNPLYRMDGTTFDITDSPGGGPCGVWVDQDGRQVVELVGQLENKAAASE
ncbi:MAG: phytanoyl-CoA dioxygenase family protein [Armatimonadota bacterium]